MASISTVHELGNGEKSCRDSNPGPLGEKREWYLCAQQPPSDNLSLKIVNVIDEHWLPATFVTDGECRCRRRRRRRRRDKTSRPPSHRSRVSAPLDSTDLRLDLSASRKILLPRYKTAKLSQCLISRCLDLDCDTIDSIQSCLLELPARKLASQPPKFKFVPGYL